MPSDSDAERLVVLLEARIRDFEKNMKKAAGTADNSYTRMRRSGRSATQQMEADMSRSSRRINQMLARTSTQIGTLGRSFAGAFAGGIFAGGAAGLVRGIRSVTSELSALGKVADKIGIGTTHLQQLRHVAELAGVEANGLDTAMQRFSRRVAQAANGSGELHGILKANNVQLRNADGSMRSQVDILRDYAELIKNAGSDQERLLLAFKAFDTEGAALVNLFKQGAAAIDTMATKTEQAGGVIDEHLIRKAEELDDKWAIVWRNFEIRAKSAVMNVVSAFDSIEDKLSEIGNSDYFKWLAEKLGASDAVFVPGEGVYNPETDELSGNARIAQAFQASARQALTEADQELIAALKERYSKTADTAVKQTIIPETGSGNNGSRNLAAEQTLREAEAVQQLIDNLTHELSLVGQSAVERAQSNALRKAGAAATDEQRQKISALVEELHRQSEAERQAVQAQQNLESAITSFGNAGFNALSGLLSGTTTWQGALQSLIPVLAQLIQTLIMMKALSGFGGGGLSVGQATLDALIGATGLFARGAAFDRGRVIPFAAGGIVSRPTLFPMANGAGLMGEAGPEAIMPLRRGRDGKLGVAGSGGGQAPPPQVSIAIHEAPGGDKAHVEQRGDGSVEVTMRRMVDGAVADSVANNGTTGRAIQKRFGVSPTRGLPRRRR